MSDEAEMAVSEASPSLPAARSRRTAWAGAWPGGSPARAVLAVGLVVILLVVGGTSALVVEFRSREIRDARRGLGNINAVVTEAAGRALQSVDLVLTSVVDDLKASGGATPEGLERRRDSRAAYEELRARVAAFRQLDAISIVDRSGRLVSFSRSFPSPPIDIADRPHFQALSDTTTPEPFLSEPVRNRGTGVWTVYLARRIVDQTGVVSGFVYGAVDLDYFLDLYGSLDLPRNSSASLWRIDGTLLARRPTLPDRIGGRIASEGFVDLTERSPPIVYESDSALDGRARMISRRVVAGFPVVIGTTLDMREVLAEWRRQSVVLAAFACLLAAATTAAVAALSR